jgi:hypothetical protein
MTPIVRIKLSDVFKSFKTDIRQFYKNRVYLQHYLHIQPNEVDNLYYYEFQWMLKDMIELLEKQNGKDNQNNMNPEEKMSELKNEAKSYTKGFGNMGNNLPKIGSGFKMPKF